MRWVYREFQTSSTTLEFIRNCSARKKSFDKSVQTWIPMDTGAPISKKDTYYQDE
jgi:hypothetical protein